MYLVTLIIVARESYKSLFMCPTLERNCWSGEITIEYLFLSELHSPSEKKVNSIVVAVGFFVAEVFFAG